MELTWELQPDGAWYAYGRRKSDPDNYKVMGKIIPPGIGRHDFRDWFWLFTDENIAGHIPDERFVPALKKYMEGMVVHQ